MKTALRTRMVPPLVLRAQAAADLMTPDPKSVRQDASVAEAAAFLSGRGFSAAPVIDDAGRPVGVVSRSDLLNYHGQRIAHARVSPLARGACGREPDHLIPVRAVMTPAVFCVHTDTPTAKLVEKMLRLNVRRLFVVDDAGALVGVVSAFDVLRGFEPWQSDN